MSKSMNDSSSAVDRKKVSKSDVSTTLTEPKRHCPESRDHSSVIITNTRWISTYKKSLKANSRKGKFTSAGDDKESPTSLTHTVSNSKVSGEIVGSKRSKHN